VQTWRSTVNSTSDYTLWAFHRSYYKDISVNIELQVYKRDGLLTVHIAVFLRCKKLLNRNSLVAFYGLHKKSYVFFIRTRHTDTKLLKGDLIFLGINRASQSLRCRISKSLALWPYSNSLESVITPQPRRMCEQPPRVLWHWHFFKQKTFLHENAFQTLDESVSCCDYSLLFKLLFRKDQSPDESLRIISWFGRHG
jgi:hypothetical protein